MIEYLLYNKLSLKLFNNIKIYKSIYFGNIKLIY